VSSVGIDSVAPRAAAESGRTAISRRFGATLSDTRMIAIALAMIMTLGFALRLIGLGAIGFAEDEINKVDAVHAYDRGDFTVNAEHPMLMKVLMDLSLRASRVWNSIAGANIAEEAAIRFPNVLLGALTAVPLFLLTAALFNRRTALLAAAFWSVGINAITYNRIGKEDTLMVFFLLFAFYFFIRAKLVIEQTKMRRLRNLSAISFGLMMGAKYFPHYFGLNMLYHHFYRMRERLPNEPRWVTPLGFFLLIGAAFVIANPAILSPRVWEYLNAYAGEKLLTHTGYLMGNHLYKNTVSASPFLGLPVYFYLLFLAIKVPLTILVTFLLGIALSVRRWREPGPGFVLFMLFFWLVPYSLFGAKWLRYTLSLMPYVYMSAAIGTVAIIGWVDTLAGKFKVHQALPQFVIGLILIVCMLLPAWSAYASASHYALYTNTLGRSYAGYFFTHDEFYDDGLNDAIRFVCATAPAGSTIVSETPAAFRYYSGKFGRTDLQSKVLSDPAFTPSESVPTFVILQRGRTYFENEAEMKNVKLRFTLVYAGCVKGHTAAEVYAAPVGGDTAVQPCGDLRP
jgi:hypothetical protein